MERSGHDDSSIGQDADPGASPGGGDMNPHDTITAGVDPLRIDLQFDARRVWHTRRRGANHITRSRLR